MSPAVRLTRAAVVGRRRRVAEATLAVVGRLAVHRDVAERGASRAQVLPRSVVVDLYPRDGMDLPQGPARVLPTCSGCS